MQLDEKIIKLFRCDCFSEGLQIISLSKEDLGTDDSVIELAFWVYGSYGNILSWKDRLRYAWYILKRGRPYCDQVIFDLKTSKEFAKEILKTVKELENETR